MSGLDAQRDPLFSMTVMKNIDFKSLLIGFLLATVLWLTMGNRNSTLDVRIVGVKKSYADWDELKVELSK